MDGVPPLLLFLGMVVFSVHRLDGLAVFNLVFTE